MATDKESKPFLVEQLPLGHLLLSRKLLDKFTPEQQKDLVSKYQNKLGLGSDASFATEAFEKLSSERLKDVKVFANAKTPAGSSILSTLDKDPATEATNHVKNKIKTVLEAGKPFEDAQKKYGHDIAAFNNLVQQVPSKYSPIALYSTIEGIRSEGVKAIKAQQQAEVTQFEALFNDPDFKNNLQSSLNIQPTDLDAVKSRMVTDLKASHKKQLDEFEKSTSESLKKIQAAQDQKNSEFLALAFLYEHGSKKMRDQLEQMATQGTLTVNLSQNTKSISDISLDKLTVFETLSGRQGKYDPATKTFSIEFPINLNFAFHQSLQQKAKADLLQLAHLVKATGSKGIKMNINFEDPKIAMQRGREAYEASVQAGFAPKDIEVHVNGKAMKPEDLFKGYEHRLGQATQKEDLSKAVYKNIKADSTEVNEIKQAINKAP